MRSSDPQKSLSQDKPRLDEVFVKLPGSIRAFEGGIEYFWFPARVYQFDVLSDPLHGGMRLEAVQGEVSHG